MKTKLLIIGALTCAAWLALSVNPATVPLEELKPISMKSQMARATTGRHETREESPVFELTSFNEYLTANFENVAERAIYDTGGNQREAEDPGAGDSATEDREESDGVFAGNLKAVGVYELEPEDDSAASESETLIYVGDWTITFYCQCEQCCGRWAWSNSTASGRTPIPWYTVAAGEDIPFGTLIEISDFGTFEVMDRGVGTNCADIYVRDHSEIPSYGITTKSVYIIGG